MCLVSHVAWCQEVTNPIIPGVADAGVLKYNGKYYLGGVFTNGGLSVSNDLIHWSTPVHVVSIDNDWIKGCKAGDDQIHANDMIYKDGKFHLYWSVNYWGKDKHAVHVVHTKSNQVLGPYNEENKKTWMDNRIDPFVFKDDDGKLYMYMVRFTDGNTVWGRPMKNPDEFSADPVYQFASLPNTWETMDNKVLEGPWVFKYRGRYYMMYNANHTSPEWGNYQLGVAEADSPLSFQNGRKYSHPVVTGNQLGLDEIYVDLLRYSQSYKPLFSFVEQLPEAGWKQLNFDDSGWKKGKAGFSSQVFPGSTTRRQGCVWTSPNLWLRKSFEVNKKLENVALRVAHDGDTKIYLNGNLVYEKDGKDYCIVNLSAKQKQALRKGHNVLAVETHQGIRNFFDVSLFDMQADQADDILLTPGQPNILRGPNGFEWWLVYMANMNNEKRSQFTDRVLFFNHELYVDGITGPHTKGYHPAPSLPSKSIQKEVCSFGILKGVEPAISYLFETGFKTSKDAGIYIWWKDDQNNLSLDFDLQHKMWGVRYLQNGQDTVISHSLPKDFRAGVYHHVRIEKDEADVAIWLDEMPLANTSFLKQLLPLAEKGLPGVFDKGGDARFEGVTYTVGFDKAQLALVDDQLVVKGENLKNYELGLQVSGLDQTAKAGIYPIYVDDNNYLKLVMDGHLRRMRLTGKRRGKIFVDKLISLAANKVVYPDVKYTDFIEKTYRFKTKTYFDKIYLNRHDCNNPSKFEENMFDFFDISYRKADEWLPLNNKEYSHTKQLKSVIAQHPAYNVMETSMPGCDGIRFINKNAEDFQNHIYKIQIHELWKESYNIRCIRSGDLVYLYVDGKQIYQLPVDFASSRIGFHTESGKPTYEGVMYYQVVHATKY